LDLVAVSRTLIGKEFHEKCWAMTTTTTTTKSVTFNNAVVLKDYCRPILDGLTG